MIISICGLPGSGKSTVAKKVAKELGFRYYSMGSIRRKMASEKGMTIEEFNKVGEKEDFTDKEVDEYQKKLGEEEDNFVIEGRTCFHFIPQSKKFFLKVDLDTAAVRIFNDPREEEKDFEDLEQLKEAIKERIESDNKRYGKYYGLKVYDESNYDFVIDTTNLTFHEVVEEILDKAQ